MKARYNKGHVVAQCPDCGGAVTTFEYRDMGREFGSVTINMTHNFEGIHFDRIIYCLMRCAGCGRGGLAKIHNVSRSNYNILGEFFPYAIEKSNIPNNIPPGIVAEFREAELCASFGAWRASSALFRSTLEKALKENGYITGTLQKRIDEAADDGVITEARKKRAHEDIRVSGNDVLHDDWREINDEEVNLAHKYVQRILEDLYDDRLSVEAILKSKGRIKPQ